jgi:RHS repeat-associated protein
VTRLTDAAQASAKTYRYDAFGRTTTETGSLSNPFQFTGRERNYGGSLYYYRARTYDPDTGRFTGKDPAGMADGTNRYAYAAGNPVNFGDPSGLVRKGKIGYGGGGGNGVGKSGYTYSCYYWAVDFLIAIGVGVFCTMGLILTLGSLLVYEGAAAAIAGVLHLGRTIGCVFWLVANINKIDDAYKHMQYAFKTGNPCPPPGTPMAGA